MPDFDATLVALQPGQTVFERHTLIRQLGRGGMGVVWLARDEKLEQEVALKFLPEVVALDAEAVRDLKRETRRALRLTHPRIVRIYDFIDDSRCAGISMEYVEGRTLASMKLDAASGCLSVAQLAPWVQQLCEALEYAHTEAQIVHRDLKPANLMLDAKGALKVADFGISATLSDTTTRASKQASSSRTPVYMSPQQMMGEKPAATDDIYSLGATLYELLTGKPPFYSGNVLLQVQNKVPPSLAARRVELGVESAEAIPIAWEETIAACLAKQSEDRPQSAAEVWKRLNGVGPDLASAPGSTVGPDLGRGRAALAARATAAPPVLTSAPSNRFGLATVSPVKFAIIFSLVEVAVLSAWYFGIAQPEQRRLAEQQRQEEGLLAEVARLENARREAEQARRTGVVPASLRRDTTTTTDGRSITISDLNLELVPISAGRFAMGSTKGGADEQPMTQVEITRPYWLGKTEVTQGQWEAVMGSNPSSFKGATRPVENVSYDDAVEFCRKLTERERAAGRLPSGYEYTLPTEAQWEYACRAGTTTAYSWGNEFELGRCNVENDPGSSETKNVATFERRGLPTDSTMPVGQFAANAWGLYDMHGNVWEWCRDWYGDYPGGTVADPMGPSWGADRVYRGGSLSSTAAGCRSAYRGNVGPGCRSSYLGFRLALSSVP